MPDTAAAIHRSDVLKNFLSASSLAAFARDFWPSYLIERGDMGGALDEDAVHNILNLIERVCPVLDTGLQLLSVHVVWSSKQLVAQSWCSAESSPSLADQLDEHVPEYSQVHQLQEGLCNLCDRIRHKAPPDHLPAATLQAVQRITNSGLLLKLPILCDKATAAIVGLQLQQQQNPGSNQPRASGAAAAPVLLHLATAIAADVSQLASSLLSMWPGKLLASKHLAPILPPAVRLAATMVDCWKAINSSSPKPGTGSSSNNSRDNEVTGKSSAEPHLGTVGSAMALMQRIAAVMHRELPSAHKHGLLEFINSLNKQPLCIKQMISSAAFLELMLLAFASHTQQLHTQHATDTVQPTGTAASTSTSNCSNSHHVLKQQQRCDVPAHHGSLLQALGCAGWTALAPSITAREVDAAAVAGALLQAYGAQVVRDTKCKLPLVPTILTVIEAMMLSPTLQTFQQGASLMKHRLLLLFAPAHSKGGIPAVLTASNKEAISQHILPAMLHGMVPQMLQHVRMTEQQQQKTATAGAVSSQGTSAYPAVAAEQVAAIWEGLFGTLLFAESQDCGTLIYALEPSFKQDPLLTMSSLEAILRYLPRSRGSPSLTLLVRNIMWSTLPPTNSQQSGATVAAGTDTLMLMRSKVSLLISCCKYLSQAIGSPSSTVSSALSGNSSSGGSAGAAAVVQPNVVNKGLRLLGGCPATIVGLVQVSDGPLNILARDVLSSAHSTSCHSGECLRLGLAGKYLSLQGRVLLSVLNAGRSSLDTEAASKKTSHIFLDFLAALHGAVYMLECIEQQLQQLRLPGGSAASVQARQQAVVSALLEQQAELQQQVDAAAHKWMQLACLLHGCPLHRMDSEQLLQTYRSANPELAGPFSEARVQMLVTARSNILATFVNQSVKAETLSQPMVLGKIKQAISVPLVQQLVDFGDAVCAAVPLPYFCNNSGCVNMSRPSELELVGGKACICAGCEVARYCGRDCQAAHWKQHKAACKRIRASRVVAS